jgi:hypothetical protein
MQDMLGKSRAYMDQTYNLPYYFRMGGMDKTGFRLSYSFGDKIIFIERTDDIADNFHMPELDVIGFHDPQDTTKGVFYKWKH